MLTMIQVLQSHKLAMVKLCFVKRHDGRLQLAELMAWERTNFQLGRSNIPMTTATTSEGREQQLRAFQSTVLEIYPMLSGNKDFIPDLAVNGGQFTSDVKYTPYSGVGSGGWGKYKNDKQSRKRYD